MKAAIFAVMCIFLLSSIAVVAVYDVDYGGYSGQASRERRVLYDPYSRDNYFGEGYTRPYVNYGSKGPTYARTNTGAKSAYSSIFNLDTNAYTQRGRDPSKISNWDPNVRGYDRLDVSVDLLPYYPVEASLDGTPRLSKGTVRLVSRGNPYGSADVGKRWIRSSIFIHLQDLPPAEDGFIYEAWLMDNDAEYPLSLGLVNSGQQFTGYLFTEISRLLMPFDAVMITKEPFPDLDPSPSDEIYLWGDIEQPRQQQGVPTSYFGRLR